MWFVCKQVQQRTQDRNSPLTTGSSRISLYQEESWSLWGIWKYLFFDNYLWKYGLYLPVLSDRKRSQEYKCCICDAGDVPSSFSSHGYFNLQRNLSRVMPSLVQFVAIENNKQELNHLVVFANYLASIAAGK